MKRCALASAANTTPRRQAAKIAAPPLRNVMRMFSSPLASVIAGRLGDRSERVHLAVAVPRVVAGAALARLGQAAFGAEERAVCAAARRRCAGELRRTRLRVRRLVDVGLDLVWPHLAVLRI